VAVVTGAAMGIGRESALAFARHGAAAVLVADIDRDEGNETVRLVEGLGTPAMFIATDVSDPRQVESLISSAVEACRRVDILHNNAGVVSGDPPWPETSVARIQEVVGVNVLGMLVGTRVAVEVMRAQGGGAIVNTASVAGLAPVPNDAVYAATKAAVIMFTRSCAPLAESHHVRVNAVLPGLVDTSMIAKTGDGERPARWLEPAVRGGIALKAEHVAAAVIALVEDERAAGETVIVRDAPPA
jgi:3-oxoacyl-[acyl-carrier protein] reductase